jgi:hypothetical protein
VGGARGDAVEEDLERDRLTGRVGEDQVGVAGLEVDGYLAGETGDTFNRPVLTGAAIIGAALQSAAR